LKLPFYGTQELEQDRGGRRDIKRVDEERRAATGALVLGVEVARATAWPCEWALGGRLLDEAERVARLSHNGPQAVRLVA